MEVLHVIDALEELVTKSHTMPLTGKCLLEREELVEMIRLLRQKLPEDVKQAKWIREERQRIITEAQKEAGTILKEAEGRIAAMIDEHEIARMADEKAAEVMAAARRASREIRVGTNEYADGVLMKLEEFLRSKMQEVQGYREELK